MRGEARHQTLCLCQPICSCHGTNFSKGIVVNTVTQFVWAPCAVTTIITTHSHSGNHFSYHCHTMSLFKSQGTEVPNHSPGTEVPSHSPEASSNRRHSQHKIHQHPFFGCPYQLTCSVQTGVL